MYIAEEVSREKKEYMIEIVWKYLQKKIINLEVLTIQTFEIITGRKKKTNPKITKKPVQPIINNIIVK